MSGLHFLVVHGGAVFRAALVALPFAGALIPYRLRARRLVREATAAREGLPVPVPLSSARKPGDEICTEGLLVGPEGARACGWVGGEAREAEGGLTLHTGDHVLAFAGPVEVVVGSRESAAGAGGFWAWRLGIAIPAGGGARRVRLVGPGDWVRVQGRLAQVLETSRYREAKTTLAIEPVRGAAAVRVAAARAPRLVAWPLSWWALGICAGLALWALLFVGGGALALHRAQWAEPGTDDGRRLSPTTLAAATPFRDEALRALVRQLIMVDGPPLAEQVARADEIYALLGDCRGQSRLPWRVEQAETARQRAEACGVSVSGDLLFAVGRMVEASVSYASEPVLRAEPAARALRRAEAHLVARDWASSASAVADYASASGDRDAHRQEALRCVANAIRARGGDEAAQKELLGHGSRAMCLVLAADLAPPAARGAMLHDLDFVWGDNQGMEFAKLLLNRTGQALLEEAGPGRGLSPGVYRYGLYPNAYLARNDPGKEAAYSRTYDMGNDVLHMEHYERTHLTDHPWAIYQAMVVKGRGDAHDPDDVRVHLVGHAALFLAATGDMAGARAMVLGLSGVPDQPPAPPLWWRPRVRDVEANVEELSYEAPFHMKGVLYGALDAALGRAVDREIDPSVARLRAVVLDREIAVPMQMLEAFARR